MNKTLTAILFAGGESRRMGVDKATLNWRGEPLWARQLRVLQEMRPDALWVSARTRPAWCSMDVTVVLDEPPSRGPLSGLAAALKELRTSHLFALAIDMPHISSEHMKKLEIRASPRCGIIPTNACGYEPLCAVYPAEASALAQETLATGAPLQVLARKLVEQNLAEVYEITEAERPLYWNANAPGDLRETGAHQAR